MGYKDCEECVGENYDDMVAFLVDAFGVGDHYCPHCGRYIGKNDYNATEPPTVVDKRDDNVCAVCSCVWKYIGMYKGGHRSR